MFQLLELPWVVLARIFRQMSSIDLISLSLMSDRAAYAVKTCKIKANCKLIFGKQHPKFVIFGRENKPIQVIFLFDAEIKEWRGIDEVEKMFNNKRKQMRIEERTGILNYRGEKREEFHFGVKRKFRRFHVTRVPPPQLNSVNFVHYKDVPDDKLLTCTIRRARSVRFPRLPTNNWIRHVMNVLNIDGISSVTFKECSTYLTSRYLYSLADLPVDSIHPDGETDPIITRMALKLFPSARHLTTEYNRAKEKKGQTSWFHELLGHQFETATLSVFCYNMVLSVDDLTLCNSRDLALFGFMIDAEHLNLFLKKWIKGSNPSLRSLEMKFARKKRNAEDFDDILEGIDYKKSGFTFEKKVDGIEIERQNGIVATLFMIQDTYLSVCHLIMLINDTCPVPTDLNGPNLIVRSLLKRENEIVENLFELPSDEHLVIEEGSKYQICVKYHVQHETIHGLEYQQTICRQNTIIEHGEFLLNGYVSKDLYKVITPTLTWSFGQCPRGLYDVHSKITDSAGNIYYHKKWTVRIN